MITMKDIIREGHPTLRKKAEKITFPVSDEIRQLADDMKIGRASCRERV